MLSDGPSECFIDETELSLKSPLYNNVESFCSDHLHCSSALLFNFNEIRHFGLNVQAFPLTQEYLLQKAFNTAIRSLSNVLREERMNSSLVQSQQEVILCCIKTASFCPFHLRFLHCV